MREREKKSANRKQTIWKFPLGFFSLLPASIMCTDGRFFSRIAQQDMSVFIFFQVVVYSFLSTFQ